MTKNKILPNFLSTVPFTTLSLYTYSITNLLANLYTCLISFVSKFQVFNSSFINSGNFLLISLSAFPTDFLTYSLASSFNGAILFIASCGLSLNYGLLVHIRNPSVTALLVFGLSELSHSSTTGIEFS